MSKYIGFILILGIFVMICACGGGDDGKEEKGLVLEVDKNNIQADGKDEAVFTVKFDGAGVTGLCETR